MHPNYIIKNAARKYTKRMIKLMKIKFQKNTEMEDYYFNKLQIIFQEQLAWVVNDMVRQDVQEYFRLVYPPQKVKTLGPKNPENKNLPKSETSVVKMYDPSPIAIQKAIDNFKSRVDSAIYRVLKIPFFIITLASRDQQRATSITAEEIRKITAEVEDALHYKEIIVKKGTPREEFVKKILIVMNKLKKTPGKLTITKISKEFTPKRTTFYGMLEKYRIEFSDDLEVIDKKTKKPFELS